MHCHATRHSIRITNGLMRLGPRWTSSHVTKQILLRCVKIQKGDTRRSHVALDVDGLPGWISNTAKPHDWMGVGDCLGADGLRPGLASLQACRRAGSTRALLFSLPHFWVPLRSSERQLWSTDTYTSFSFLGFNSILIHRHGQFDDKLAGSLDSLC